MEQSEIIVFWGIETLACWSPAVLGAIPINECSKDFLQNVGMPREVGMTLRFGPQSDENQQILNPGNFLIIGFDDFIPICLDVMNSRRIVAVEEEFETDKIRFINSSVELFAESLVYYERYRRLAIKASDKDIMEAISFTKDKLIVIDPLAFTDCESWWPVIIEQMEYGFL